MIILAVVCVFSLLGYATCEEDISDLDYLDDGVVTPSGKITGQLTQFYGELTRAYLGIPYAKPPVGDLRFKKPEPAEPWSDTLTADIMPPACIQYTDKFIPWYDADEGKSEDCLYLNIWTPRFAPSTMKLPVMFWIYGGSFTVGSNRLNTANGQGLSLIGPAIVVSPNYRMGAFGFMSSGTEDAPGNAGIHDLIMALQWVKKNIAPFGGDPEKITIFGQDSGSITVSMFLMSPLTKGLFSRAIMQSGSFLSLRKDSSNYNLELGQSLAESVECASENQTLKANPKEVVDCLRGVEANRLAVALNELNPDSIDTFLPQYGDDFLPKNPTEDLKNGEFHDVPLLIGSNQDEGSYSLVSKYPELFGPTGQSNLQLVKSFGETILRRSFSNFPDSEEVVQQYLGDLEEEDFSEVREQVYTALGDYNVTCPTMLFAENYSKGNNTVQYYVFAERPTLSPWAPWMGVTHYDEVPLVFARPLDGFDIDKFYNFYRGELGLTYIMARWWANFANNGSAMDFWKNYSSTHHQYVLIRYNEKKKMRGPGPQLDNCNFFRKYYDI